MSSQIPQNDLEWITAYLDGQLAEQDRQRLEQRMAADADFKAEVDSFRNLRILLKRVPQRPVPRSFVLKPEMVAAKPGWFGRLFPVFRFSSLAAALLLVATYAVNLLPVRMMASATEAGPEALAAPAAALALDVEPTAPIIIMGQSGNMPAQNYGSGGGGSGPAYGLGGGGAAESQMPAPAADRSAEMKSSAETEPVLPTPEVFPLLPEMPAVGPTEMATQEPEPALMMESAPASPEGFQVPSFQSPDGLLAEATLQPTPEPYVLPTELPTEPPVPTVQLTPVDIPTYEPTPSAEPPAAAAEMAPAIQSEPASGPILGLPADGAAPAEPAAPVITEAEPQVQTDLTSQLREVAPGLRWIFGGVLALAALLTLFSWRARRM